MRRDAGPPVARARPVPRNNPVPTSRIEKISIKSVWGVGRGVLLSETRLKDSRSRFEGVKTKEGSKEGRIPRKSKIQNLPIVPPCNRIVTNLRFKLRQLYILDLFKWMLILTTAIIEICLDESPLLKSSSWTVFPPLPPTPPPLPLSSEFNTFSSTSWVEAFSKSSWILAELVEVSDLFVSNGAGVGTSVDICSLD